MRGSNYWSTKNSYWKFPLLSKFMIQCKQRFPSDTRISLIWGKGVTSKTGVATDQIKFSAFKRGLSLLSSIAKGRIQGQGVHPSPPWILVFFASISKDQANEDRPERDLVGKTWEPHLYSHERREATFINLVWFKGHFPENTNFSVELPTGLKVMRAGRLSMPINFHSPFELINTPPLAKFSARFGIL